MLHLVLAWALLALMCLHVAGVLHAGRRQHESLLLAMISGRKRRRG